MSKAIRVMRPSDVASAMELSIAANWNQTTEDWLRIVRLAGEGSRCIDDSGNLVATACLLPYGTQLGWIGMVLTRPEFRNQGLAMQLVDEAIRTAELRGVRTIKLDATDAGRRLYEKFGFVVEQTVERWSCEGSAAAATANNGPSIAPISGFSNQRVRLPGELAALDKKAFGVDRQGLVDSLCESGKSHCGSGGYVLSRSGRLAQYLGPCVADSAAEGRRLISASLADAAAKGRDWYWDLLPANQEAVRWATEFGFERRRILWRMRRGESMESNDALVYAIAGFEFG